MKDHVIVWDGMQLIGFAIGAVTLFLMFLFWLWINWDVFKERFKGK